MSSGQVSIPLVIRTPGGGGRQLSATHSQNLEAWYAHVPGLKVVAPATCADAKGLLAAAIRDDDLVLVQENLALYNIKGEVPDGEHVAEIGRAAVLKPGRDVTVIGYSRAAVITTEEQVAAATALRKPAANAGEIPLITVRRLFRAQANQRPGADVKVTVTDLLIRACVTALAAHREEYFNDIDRLNNRRSVRVRTARPLSPTRTRCSPVHERYGTGTDPQGGQEIMSPNSALAAWQLAMIAVVPVLTLAAWLTLVLLADRHPRGRSAAADAAHDHEETAATVTDLPPESPPSGKAAA